MIGPFAGISGPDFLMSSQNSSFSPLIVFQPFVIVWRAFTSLLATVFHHSSVARAALEEEKKQPPAPKRSADERAFLPAALEILETPPSPIGRWMLWTIMIFFTLATIWATVSKIDIVTVTSGKIVPSGQVKIVQPAEQGVVRAIHIREGERVKAGQVLIELDTTDSSADMERLAVDTMEASIEVSRLRAMVSPEGLEILGQPGGGYPEFVVPQGADPLMVSTQVNLMRSLIAEHRAKLANLQQEILRMKSSLARIEANIATLTTTVPLIRERVVAKRKLAAKKFASRTELLQLEQELAESSGELAAKRHEKTETEAQLEALQQKVRQANAEYERQRFAELAEAERRLTQNSQDLIKATHNMSLQTLKASTDGVVQEMQIHTIGGVVTPAQELMKIVPEEAGLEVEAMVENKDIGFIEEGQVAEVKIETFNFTKYGVIDGEVLHVSLDAVNDEEKGLIYKARIGIDQDSIWVEGKEVHLSSGMAVTAEVKTGRRRIIEYLLTPLLRASQEAMRER